MAIPALFLLLPLVTWASPTLRPNSQPVPGTLKCNTGGLNPVPSPTHFTLDYSPKSPQYFLDFKLNFTGNHGGGGLAQGLKLKFPEGSIGCAVNIEQLPTVDCVMPSCKLGRGPVELSVSWCPPFSDDGSSEQTRTFTISYQVTYIKVHDISISDNQVNIEVPTPLQKMDYGRIYASFLRFKTSEIPADADLVYIQNPHTSISGVLNAGNVAANHPDGCTVCHAWGAPGDSTRVWTPYHTANFRERTYGYISIFFGFPDPGYENFTHFQLFFRKPVNPSSSKASVGRSATATLPVEPYKWGNFEVTDRSPQAVTVIEITNSQIHGQAGGPCYELNVTHPGSKDYCINLAADQMVTNSRVLYYNEDYGFEDSSGEPAPPAHGFWQITPRLNLDWPNKPCGLPTGNRGRGSVKATVMHKSPVMKGTVALNEYHHSTISLSSPVLKYKTSAGGVKALEFCLTHDPDYAARICAIVTNAEDNGYPYQPQTCAGPTRPGSSSPGEWRCGFIQPEFSQKEPAEVTFVLTGIASSTNALPFFFNASSHGIT